MEKQKNRNAILKQKIKGDSTYIATLISIFMLVAVFAVLFYSVAQISSQNKIERAYRQYLLQMETQGYLTDSARASLIQDLTALGVTNIDLSGTTISPVEYGGKVVLHISGDLAVDAVKSETGAHGDVLKKGQEVIRIDITKTGTALY